MKKILISIVIVLCLIGGIFIGYKLFSPKESKTVVTSQTILTALQKQGFLVSQSYIFNQTVTIDTGSGNEWKDIFWGQKITAGGTIRINSGVNLQKLTAQDVVVTPHQITLTLPAIERQSTEVIGDIMLTNQQGILKKIFNSDDGYNLAVERLKSQAENAAAAPELKLEAEENAKGEIAKLLQFVDGSKKVVVEFTRSES